MIGENSVVEALTHWLVDDMGAGQRIDSVETLSGGYSQMMMAFTLHGEHGADRLVLRANRPAGESVTSTDRALEWAVIESLSRRGEVSLPTPRWFDDGTALGVPCFVVDRVDGATVSRAYPGLDIDTRAAVSEKLCDLMAAIHSTPLDALPAELDRPIDWDLHIDSLIDKWRQVERNGLEPDPFVRHLANWLQAHKPAPAPMTLVHGEINNDNLLLGSDGDLSAVDWEFAHIGDPREDIGWYRTVSEGAVPPDLLADDIEGFCARYRAVTGLGADIINPAAIGYFGLLATVGVYSTLVGGPAAVEASPAAPVLAAYMSAVLSRTHLILLRAMRDLDAALPSATVHNSQKG
ncbi:MULTISPECIES: phosphotransferase family protein [Mycolicibacterium]|jgi:aminoglycoside phosphotransferase (APT) family kinase protein|uniref:phosphotransferase family protein n=2 Tax=Actinomycetes TaxID=1760 RepID=UPI000A72F786|nr:MULTISPECIES: phosphotransferase family protein [Mycobacteriaceae]TDH46935.1 phosphotransferase family protein [Mycobacterium eburneum]